MSMKSIPPYVPLLCSKTGVYMGIHIFSRDVNECLDWYSNIRIGYSNIFEYSNYIHIYAQ